MTAAKTTKGPGRPQIVATPEEFEAKVTAYRESCVADERPVTITGMAYYLGFASRQSFYDYGKRDGFSYPVKRARLLVEAEYEARLSGNSPTGAIFALKNQGWSDSREYHHSGEITTVVRDMSDEDLHERATHYTNRMAQHTNGNGPSTNGDG